MNYVNDFDFYGKIAKQIPCITGKGAPTEATEGAVGCFYMDTDTGNTYKCTAIKDGMYVWVADTMANTDGAIKAVSGFAELQNALTNGYKNISIAADFEIAKQVEVPEGVTIIGNGHTIRRADNFQTDNNYGHTATEMAMFNVQANFHIEDLTIDGNRENCKDPSWEMTHEITLHGNALVNNINIINGNECIIAFGDDNVIQNSTFTNCSGNAIHFSGGKRTRLLNNTFKNTNLDSINGVDLGHKGGCVSWSASCEDVTAIGNWLENGYAGFGFIGGEDNSRLKIIGNTVKNCERAIDAIFTNLNPVKNVIIQSNNFVDSYSVTFSNTDNKAPAKINGIIDGNNFENTGVTLSNVADFVITNNIFNEKTELCSIPISCTNSSRITISDNHCVSYAISGSGISCGGDCFNIKVLNNYVRAKRYGIYLETNKVTDAIVDGNIVKEIYGRGDTDFFGCLYGKNVSITNNVFVTYKQGIEAWEGALILNNKFYTADPTTVALKLANWSPNVLVRDNRTTGKFSITTGDTSVNENNTMSMTDTAFANLTMNLTNLTSDNVPTKVTKGDEFVFTLIANEGYSLPENITIINNGVNCIISDFEYDNTTGVVVLYCVVGDVVVTANA